MKNQLISALLKVVRPTPHVSAHPKKALIVSTTGLGDTLWATPAIRAFKKSYPQSQLTLLTSPIGAQLLSQNPHIDRLYVLSNPVWKDLKKLYPLMKKESYDTAFIFHTSQRPVLPFIKMLGPARIIGSRGINKGLDHLLTQAIPQQYEHEIDRRLRLMAATGAAANGTEMELHIDEPYENVPPAYAILHPGSKDKFKQWHPKHFTALGQQLTLPIILTGNGEERELCQSIASQIPGAISLAGALSLGQMASVIKKASFMVTNDTGPMHMALALRTPTVALFGPTDPHLCGPLHCDFAHVIQVKPTCTPCLKKRCQAPFCLSQIGVSQVLAHCNALLTQKQPLCPLELPS